MPSRLEWGPWVCYTILTRGLERNTEYYFEWFRLLQHTRVGRLVQSRRIVDPIASHGGHLTHALDRLYNFLGFVALGCWLQTS